MTIEGEIRTRLQATTDVTALVGTRCYDLRLPEKAQTPAITYQRISSSPYFTYSAPVAMVGKRIQVDSWAQTGSDVVSLAIEVRKALNGFSGTPSAMKIHGIFIADEQRGYEVETQLHRMRQDYLVFYNEST